MTKVRIIRGKRDARNHVKECGRRWRWCFSCDLVIDGGACEWACILRLISPVKASSPATVYACLLSISARAVIPRVKRRDFALLERRSSSEAASARRSACEGITSLRRLSDNSGTAELVRAILIMQAVMLVMR